MASTDSKSRRQLLQQAEKILLHPIYPHLISYCPTMDLIAVVTDEENLDVYRIAGQRAFGLKRKSGDVTVDALQWEFNGKSIAVSWSDGSTDLVSAETGKVSHKDLMLPVEPSNENSMLEEEVLTRVKCMGWGLNFINVEAVKKRTGWKEKKKANGATPKQSDAFDNPTTENWDAFRDETTLEDFLQRQPDFQSLDIAPDLPDQLAMMDMEVLLPKLPAITLPPALPFMRVSAADSGAFSSQAEVDTLLHSHHLKDHNSVDMFIRCSDRGTIHPSIYDSLETVNVRLPKAWNIEGTPLLHTGHPYSCTHSLLMRTTSASVPRKQRIALVPLALNFIPSAGIYLHLIASKTSQLQNLLLYLTQTLQRIRTFHKHAQDLPSKFMLNISETLEEKEQGDLMTNLFHVACTGNCPQLVREWLVDELAEQGHKRWDNAVTSSLTTLLALVHENLIPALDRCSIVLSRLRGLAQFHDREWIFSAPVAHFSVLLDGLAKLRLLTHTVLRYASEEKRQFGAFSRWLRFTIDFEATEPESQSRAEMETRDPGVDVSLVLEYIKHGLTKSALGPYLKQGQKMVEDVDYEDTKKAIELLKEGAAFKEEGVCLESVLGGFGDGVKELLRQVSKWQESNIQMNSGIVLEERDISEADGIVDVRMVFEHSPTSPDRISTYVTLSYPSSSSKLHIHHLTHAPNMSSLPRDIHAYTVSTLDFSTSSDTNTKILDAKFADDTHLLVLLQQGSELKGKAREKDKGKGKSRDGDAENILISLPYTCHASTTFPTHTPLLPHAPISHSSIVSTLLPRGVPVQQSSRQLIQLTPELVQKHLRHVFEGRFTPLKLIVNGRKGRRVVVVLGSDRKHYRVLDLDFKERKTRAKTEGDGSGETGSESESDEDGDGDVEMAGL